MAVTVEWAVAQHRVGHRCTERQLLLLLRLLWWLRLALPLLLVMAHQVAAALLRLVLVLPFSVLLLITVVSLAGSAVREV